MFPIIKSLRAYWGHDRYSAETFDRLIHSVHVKDLRWIAYVTTYAALAAIIVIGLVAYEFPKQVGAPSKLYDLLVPLQISAVLAGLGGIVAWCYQTGSARLGTVDLFACEIITLCRIWTVNGVVDNCVKAFEIDIGGQAVTDHEKITERRARFTHFDSLEAYTPVFDLNAKELRSLNVKVLTNMTAFYSYWKGTRDAYRKLANTSGTKIGAIIAEDLDPWHRAMREVIYLQFLACESARKAVRDLIEFEPNNAENIITILLSELPAYHFLLNYFPKNDVRHARLELRRDRYRTVIPQIYYHALDEHEKFKNIDKAPKSLRRLAREDREELSRDWDKAYGMLEQLKERYQTAIGDLPVRARKPHT